MTLKNEIFEGIAAYKALTPTTQDQYYDEMYRQARKQREQEEKGERDEIAEAERKRAGTATAPPALITPPTVSSTTTPSVLQPPPALQTDYPQLSGTYRRGGRVSTFKGKRYAGGGPVDRDPDNPIDDIVDSVLRSSEFERNPDRRATLRGEDIPRTQEPYRDLPSYERPGIQVNRYGRSLDRSVASAPAPPDPSAEIMARGQADRDAEWIARNRAQAEQKGLRYRDQSVSQAMAADAPYSRQPTAPPVRPPPPDRSAAFRGSELPTNMPSSPGGEPLPPPPPSTSQVPPRGSAAAAQAPVVPGGPMSPGGEPMPPPTPPARGPDLSEAIATSGGAEAAARAIPKPEIYGPNEPTSSAAGRAVRSLIPGFGDEAKNRRYKELTDELATLQPGPFTPQTDRERAENAPRIAQIEAEIAALRADARTATPAAVAPGATPPAPGKAPPPPAAAAPAAPAGGVYGKVPGPQTETGGEALVTNAPTPYPTKVPPAKGPNQVPVKTAPKQNGPATAGSTGPGGGQGAQPAPPRGAQPGGPSSQPYTQQTAPKGSLGDQTRVTAFDPTADLYDSRNAQRVTQDYRSREATGAPTQLAPQDIQRTMQGIVQQMPNGPQVPGQNAASRPAYNRFVQAHNPTGKLEPGEAALVGMVGRYKVLLRQGRMKEAGQLAMGIMQAASLEAAVRGRQAVDMFKSGDTQGGKNLVMDGLSHTPDGRSHQLNADGSITSYDSSGQPTGQTQMTGEQWLALAMGLSDGSLIWKSLQQTVAMLQTPDKDAEGRSLGNDLKRLQIERERQRIAQGNMPRTGRAPAAPAPRSEAADAILGQK